MQGFFTYALICQGWSYRMFRKHISADKKTLVY
jgi:hypothetical protein